MDKHDVFRQSTAHPTPPQARYYAVFEPPLDPRAIGARFKVLCEIEATGAS